MIPLYDVATAEATILRRAATLSPALPAALQATLERRFGSGATAQTAVAHVLADVQNRGDIALRHWTKELDQVTLENFAIPATENATALRRLPRPLFEALNHATSRIREFHNRQPLPHWTTDEMGGRLGQRVTPLRRVGIYVPGGTAPLPSSLLMAAIPAAVAGVDEVVVATPPGPDGRIPDIIIAAANLAGVLEIYTIGGAQAIAALAFGTESIPRVDKIVGPGNLFVTEAKRQVYGLVGIDGLYGPTETIVIADATANPEWVAADLLAQAEHDVLASAILLTPDQMLATAVQAAVARQLESLSRADIIAAALDGQGGIVLTTDVAEAVRLADEYAPEHLCLAVSDPARWVPHIRSAGGLFLGERSFEVLGDYVAGPSHTMPTGGTARFASPLNVLDFVRITSIIALDDATAALLSPVAATLAEAEQLTAHAQAARFRARQEPGP